MASTGLMTPRQIGAILNPSRAQMVMLHMEMEKEGVVPDDNIYLDLPSTLVKDREWNLPLTKEHLLYSVRCPMPADKDKARRTIGGTNATWHWQASNPVADMMGQKIGTETLLNLEFHNNDNGNVTSSGIWRAMEYRSLTSDGTSAIVVLTCTDQQLVKQEEKLKEAESQLTVLHRDVLEHQFIGDLFSAEEDRSNVEPLEKKLTKMRNSLKLAKDRARQTEAANAAGIVIDPLPNDLREGQKRRKKQT